MFIIIGGDGKEYGPVTSDQVRTWIAAGRASLDTKAKALGSDEWRRLGDYAEFSSPDGAPPVIAAAPAMSASFAPSRPTDAANRWLRLGGAFVDGVLVTLCKLPAAIAIWRVLAPSIMAGEQPSFVTLMAATDGAFMKAVPYLLALAAVQCVLLSTRGQSIGKLLFQTRIVRHRDGAKAGFVHAFLLRGSITWVVEQIPILGWLYWIVDACFVFGDERRCVHDYIGGTRVVKA